MSKCDCGAASGTPPYQHTSGCPAGPKRSNDFVDSSAAAAYERSLAAGLLNELPDGTVTAADPVELDQHQLIEGAFSDTWRLRLEAQGAPELSLPPVLVKPHCTCRTKGSRRGVHTADCLLSSNQRRRFLAMTEGNPVTHKSTDLPGSADNVENADADETVECTMECNCAHAPGDDPGHKEGCPFYGQEPALAEPEAELGELPIEPAARTRLRATPAGSETGEDDEDWRLHTQQAPTARAIGLTTTNILRLSRLNASLAEATKHIPISVVLESCLSALAPCMDIPQSECEGLAIDMESWIATYLRPDAENDTIPFASLGDSLAPHFKAHEAPYLVGELLRLVSRRYGLSTSEVSDLCDAWVRKHEEIAEVPSSQTEGVRAELEKRLYALANLSSASDALHACLDVVVTRCGNTPDSLTAVVDAWLDAHAPQRYGEPEPRDELCEATTELTAAMNNLATKVSAKVMMGHCLTTLHKAYGNTKKEVLLAAERWAYPGVKPVRLGPTVSDERLAEIFEELRSINPTQIPVLFKGTGVRLPTSDDLVNYPLMLVFGAPLTNPPKDRSAHPTYAIEILKGRNPGASSVLFDPSLPLSLGDADATQEEPAVDQAIHSGERLAAIHAEAKAAIRAAVQSYADGVLELCKATGMRAMSITINTGSAELTLEKDAFGLMPVSIITAYSAGNPVLETSLLAALPELPECGAKLSWPLG